MDRVGAPDNTWLLCIEYVLHLLNHLAHKSLNNQVPLTKMFGVTVDISAFLNFTFWQPVYYAAENKWPSESAEKSGRWVGIAPNVGDALTYTILTDDTNKLIFRSAVRARDGKTERKKNQILHNISTITNIVRATDQSSQGTVVKTAATP